MGIQEAVAGLHAAEGQKIVKLNPSQVEFLLDWHRHLFFFGGVGNGKTTIGVIKMLITARHFPKFRGLIGRLSWPTLESSTMDEFYTICPPHWIKEARKSAGSPKCVLKNGSEILFRHLEIKGDRRKAFQRLSNLNLNMVLIDQAEEIDPEWFTLFRGRLRRQVYDKRGNPCPNQAMYIGNMAGHNWIWKEAKQPIEMTGQPLHGHHLIEATTYENKANLPPEFITDLENTPRQWYRRYVMGSWEEFSGLILKLNKEDHEVDPFEIPPSWERYRSIDHGETNPTSCHWWAVDEEGNCFCYDEYYERDRIIREHTRAIMDQSEPDKDWGYIYSVWDPSVMYKTRQNEVMGKHSIYDEYIDQVNAYINEKPTLRNVGLWGHGGINDILAGVARINDYAFVDPTHRHPITGELGSSRIFWFKDRTPMFWAEQGGYVWKPGSLGPDGVTVGPAPEVPDPKCDDHAMDETRYFIMTRPAINALTEVKQKEGILDAWKRKEQENYLKNLRRSYMAA